LLPHSQDQNKAVELFWAKPEGNGPFPVVLFIHGHQEGPRDGGEAYVRTGRLGIMARRGYVSAAVSQPGYGNSAGPPDYCGPFTQQAVLVAIDFLRRQPFVRANKVALFGYSRGAIVAAMVATQDPGLAAVVLGAGAYDFFNWHPTLRGIARNRDAEAGTSADAFMARSAMYHAEQIKAPARRDCPRLGDADLPPGYQDCRLNPHVLNRETQSGVQRTQDADAFRLDTHLCWDGPKRRGCVESRCGAVAVGRTYL